MWYTHMHLRHCYVCVSVWECASLIVWSCGCCRFMSFAFTSSLCVCVCVFVSLCSNDIYCNLLSRRGGGVWWSTKLYQALFLLFPIVCVFVCVCVCIWVCAWACRGHTHTRASKFPLRFEAEAAARAVSCYFEKSPWNELCVSLRSDEFAVRRLRDADSRSRPPVHGGAPGKGARQEEGTASHP